MLRKALCRRLFLEALEDRRTPATFTVMNTLDAGTDSLRQAILSANFNSGPDTITFDPTVFASAKTITLTTGVLSITDAVTITGPGAKLATISGNNADRVFDVNVPGTGTAVAISGVTMTGGNRIEGGGMFNLNAALTLTECAISGNKAFIGGGIYANGGSLVVQRCTLSGNSAGSGGAIVFYSYSGSLTVDNSTISSNTVTSVGGGIYFGSKVGSGLTVRNSTITNNMASTAGGIFRLPNSTPNISLESSIVSGNYGGSTPDIDSGGIPVLANFSAVGSNVGFTSLIGNGNLAFGVNPKLGPLADNGGPTQTHSLLPDSPAIDAGSNVGAFTTDQRGKARTWNAQADIGAVESDPLFIVRNTNDAGKDSLRQLVLDANAFIGANTIAFDPTVFALAKSIKLTTGQLSISDPLTITGPGAKLATVSGNNASRVFSIDIPGVGAAVGINGLTITGGKTANGGGLLVEDDSLTLTECAIVGNTATTKDGGGIHVHNGGSLTVQRSTFSGNSAPRGGAIDFFSAGGTLLVENSTISGNSASEGGGGIYFRGKAGGGITIRNGTITSNTSGGNGGGIDLSFGNAPNMSLESSIVSGNSSFGAVDIYNYGKAVAANFSAVGSNAGFTSLTGTGNLPFAADLKLGPLADNGGPTQTHTLLPGSLAVDAGLNIGGLTADQRGLVRTWNGQADIGAVESDPQFVVRNTNDAGKDSLRQQVVDANAFVGANTITFDPTVFASAKTITLTSEIIITDAATITGPIVGVIVSGGGNTRIFNATSAPAGTLINFAMLTLTAGSATGRGGAYFGDNQVVTFTDCYMTKNSSSNYGGALSFDADGPFGKLTLVRCGVMGNHAVISGGGIDAFGTSITIQNSTLAGNSAKNTGSGGAISVSAPSLTIVNSTLSGNVAMKGGAIQSFNTTVIIQNSTITGNAADFGGGIILQSGPAISLESSIVSGNSGGSAPDIFSAIAVTANFSAVGSNAGFTSLTGTGNLPFGTDLKLGPLAYNGGPTQTHALLPGSAALNVGNNAGASTSDQRGLPRVVGTTDIGAFELQPAAKVANVVVGDGTVQRSMVTQIKVTFDSTVVFTGNPAAAFALSRSNDSAAVNLAAVVSGNDVTLTFTGGAVDGKSLSDGLYTLIVLANQIGADGFDGDGNGTGGDDYILVASSSASPRLFRLFGDITGDGTVAANDFIQFRLALGGTNHIFDFDNDGAVAASDFIQFRLRFGGSI